MSEPRKPAPPQGDNLLHTKGNGSTPSPTTHRESGKPQVKAK
jgi:hypothetical protein